MAEVKCRVTVETAERVLAKEMFASRKDADTYMEQYLAEEDNILERVGPGAYTVALDEFCIDQWVCAVKKLVVV
jgi:hypothetical protein|nr:MAG TPA: hypothetical protein [Caudoviricetes sp.]